MSRIVRKPAAIPEGVEVAIIDGLFKAKGKNGEFTRPLDVNVLVSIKEDGVWVEKANESRQALMMIGTMQRNIINVMHSAHSVFEKKMYLNGVGYKGEVKGKTLVLNLGYSHPIEMEIPEGVTVTFSDPTHFVVSGFVKEVVGNFAAEIKSKRKPEPYKLKGVFYEGEYVEKKEGKKK